MSEETPDPGEQTPANDESATQAEPSQGESTPSVGEAGAHMGISALGRIYRVFSPSLRFEVPSTSWMASPRGCLAMVVMVLAILTLAILGIQLLAGLLAGGGADGEGAMSATEQGDGGSSAPTQQGEAVGDLPFIPRPGVYDIENLPFLPDCGPGDLGSGFEEGTIEVADDGSRLTATGSTAGTASFDMRLVDQSADRLVYVGIEPVTGIELTFVFTSPTTLEANVRATGETCIERPAVGEWDREVGAPDPDAPLDVDLPLWAPQDFPTGDSRTIDVDEGDGGTFTVVFEDTQPNEVLLLLDEWADGNGHVVASFAPGQPEDDPADGSLAYTAVVELSDGRVMDVEIVDIGGFDTRLTATIRSG